MFTDARIRTALEAMVHGIDAPPVPLSAIQRKIAQPPAVTRYAPRYLRPAIATAAIIAAFVVALPSISPAFIQSIDARYRAALQALGGIAPPTAPNRLVAALVSRSATLASAQARVHFTIVAPAGLPADIVSEKISTTPTGVYSKAARSWHVGAPVVTFAYQRTGARSFSLMAERFDPHGERPGKYMFEAMDPAPDGRPVLVKHEQFAWRNGDQMMRAIAGQGISATEIESIRAAMHGAAVPLRELHAPDRGSSYRLYRGTKP